MNAKTLERLVAFRNDTGIVVMKEIIFRKIHYQFSVVGKKSRIVFYRQKLEDAIRDEEIFLIEASAAKEYWHNFKNLIFGKCDWFGRKPHHKDVVNQFLDIGYHYLAGRVARTFEEIGLPTELGLLHRAQSATAKPFVYDFMEWLRPIVVDRALLVMIRKKKRKFETVPDHAVAYFVNALKNQFDRLYFDKSLGYGITLAFWARLNALHLLHAINHGTYPVWRFPSLRHESRCKKRKIPTMSIVGTKKK